MSDLYCIAVATGSRADWSLLSPVIIAIREQKKLELALWVTGSHLEEKFGHTVDQIIEQGFSIDEKIKLNINTVDAQDTSQALANSIQGFSKAIHHRRPDLLLILGDRYEIFGAAQAALLAGVPIAHIAGGDISEGAYDDAMRHAISKLSNLHFVTNQEAADRLKQMGEKTHNIILSGSPGIDAIIATPRLSRVELEQKLDWTFCDKNIAVSFHPATIDKLSSEQQVDELTKGLRLLPQDIGIIISGSNADTGGNLINEYLQNFSQSHPHCCFIQSLGQQGYYSVLAEVDLLIGNSSSGLYEAPSLQTATLNIGNRQRGRLQASSVTNCINQHQDISTMIQECLQHQPDHFNNPYGDGHAATIIVDTLVARTANPKQLHKSFIDRDCGDSP